MTVARFPPVRLPSPDRVALLLDFDGTLVDIAPAPDLVVVPAMLAVDLASLRDRLGGALAIVTGRSLEQVDHFLPRIPGAVAAEHGAIIRRAPDDEPEHVPLPAIPAGWLDDAARVAAGQDGVLLERKETGFALHYRAAPEAGPALRRFLDDLVGGRAAEFHVLAAKMAWELRARGADKGSAVASLMRAPPFRGRMPVFVGDDVTDQDGIDAAARLGGRGYLVPDAFGEPADVRAWLRRLAHDEDDAWEG